MEKLLAKPKVPIKIKTNPPARKASVCEIEPAGARAPPEAVAILSGSWPIVRVKAAVVEPEVMVMVLSPDRSLAGVHDQLPCESAVAATDWLPTVPETASPAVVTPEKVGLADVTQNCCAPWIKVTPPTCETRPEPANVALEKQLIATREKRRKETTEVNPLVISDNRARLVSAKRAGSMIKA